MVKNTYGTGRRRLIVKGCAIRVEKVKRKRATETVGVLCC